MVGWHGCTGYASDRLLLSDVMRTHSIIERGQCEQRLDYGGVKNPKLITVVTPTYGLTFQALNLTGLIHLLEKKN